MRVLFYLLDYRTNVWRPRRDLNSRQPVSKTGALPLSYEGLLNGHPIADFIKRLGTSDATYFFTVSHIHHGRYASDAILLSQVGVGFDVYFLNWHTKVFAFENHAKLFTRATPSGAKL